jgi:hypothetical protein
MQDIGPGHLAHAVCVSAQEGRQGRGERGRREGYVHEEGGWLSGRRSGCAECRIDDVITRVLVLLLVMITI